MDLSSVRLKLDNYNKPKGGAKYEKIDYTKSYFKPTVGKHVLRFVPSKFAERLEINPFHNIYFHYGFAKYPVLALTNWGEKDPIVEFVKELRKSKDPEDWAMAKKLAPKERVFIPVIVRGEEEKGVRLWEVGVTIYKELLSIATDEDYGGDYTSITDGKDFTIEVKEETKFDKLVKTVSSIRIKPKASPLSEDAEQVTKWLENQPDVLTLNKKHSFEEIKTILEKYLGDTEDESAPIASADEDDADTPPANYKPVTKASKADKFDELFQEEAK